MDKFRALTRAPLNQPDHFKTGGYGHVFKLHFMFLWTMSMPGQTALSSSAGWMVALDGTRRMWAIELLLHWNSFQPVPGGMFLPVITQQTVPLEVCFHNS